ncbi:capZ-interacting protein-like isoform X2 [Syngnathus acus]|uniref:capZ-interacting protein-like isoform X2 n=1 Tax=Syngnathus acus TaxID=161584 RepID=UPI001885D922|nr:capZ-interacting protein-like isoform X2 [Syngnathus acus]
MEETASLPSPPSRPSVAELAGRFKVSSPPIASETEAPVRRRAPRSLQLPKSHEDEQERPSGVTSPVKAKRNSALVEKLQANLALSPAALLPLPMSPSFRLPPLFKPPTPTTGSPSSTPTSPGPDFTPLASEEEGPVSFEAPPAAAAEGCLLNVSKSRARHSIRRRPPSRRRAKSGSGEEVGVATEELDTGKSQSNRNTTPGAADVFAHDNRNRSKEGASEEGRSDEQGEGSSERQVDREEENQEKNLRRGGMRQ